MAGERIVTEWVVDPTKAQKGAKQASDAVKEASAGMAAQAAKADEAIAQTFQKDVAAKKGAASAAKKAAGVASDAAAKAGEIASQAAIKAARDGTKANKQAARVAKAVAADKIRLARLFSQAEKTATTESVKALRELEKQLKRVDKAQSRIIRGVRKRGDDTKISLDKTRGGLRGLEKGLGAAAFSAGNFEQSMSGAGRELLLTSTSLGVAAGAIAAVSLAIGFAVQQWKKMGEAARKAQELQLENRRKVLESLDQEVSTLRDANREMLRRIVLEQRLGRLPLQGEQLVFGAEVDLSVAEQAVKRQEAVVAAIPPAGGLDDAGERLRALQKLSTLLEQVDRRKALLEQAKTAKRLSDSLNESADAAERLKKSNEDAAAVTAAVLADEKAKVKALEASTVAVGKQVDLLRLVASGESARTAAITQELTALDRKIQQLDVIVQAGDTLTKNESDTLFFLQEQVRLRREQKELIEASGPTPPGGGGLGEQLEKTTASGVSRGLVSGIREGGDAAGQILESTLTAALNQVAQNFLTGESGLITQIFRLGATGASA